MLYFLIGTVVADIGSGELIVSQRVSILIYRVCNILGFYLICILNAEKEFFLMGDLMK